MGSSSKRQTTMAKIARERALQEKRALKAEKKAERKAARLAEAEGTAPIGEAEGTETAEPGETAVEADERPGDPT